jgi:hypothetical protein
MASIIVRIPHFQYGASRRLSTCERPSLTIEDDIHKVLLHKKFEDSNQGVEHCQNQNQNQQTFCDTHDDWNNPKKQNSNHEQDDKNFK